MNLAAGSSQNVEFAFTNLDYNETYFVNFYYYNNGEQVRINGTATRKVESPYLVTSITLDEQEMTLNVGEERTLAATVLPDDADYKTVLWTSSNPEVASVDASGLVTALSHGTTTITATTTDGSNLSATCLVTVVEEPVFTAGDVNDDGDINIGDYANVASYILEQDPQPFNFAAADLDGNNEINVGDLAGVAHLALHYEGGAPQGAPAVNAAEPRIAIDASTSGNTVTINLSNNVGITALQMDLGLPQGTALVDATLTDRASASHQVAFSQLANGQYRLLASSSTCKTLAGTSGAVLTLTLAGTLSGNGSLSNIVLASPTATCYRHNDIDLNFSPTGISDVYSSTRIYSDGNNIVIISPTHGTAQLIMPSGMSRTVEVARGRNVYRAPAQGVIIVKTDNTVKKLHILD